ncbi:low-affinity zinc ion transporter-like protein [Lindgomyces ingoldianus]|uniref:Low-affinity zinc ion transporter-like protein n=1 Tax=Lindgomyces ingoldianus TaxID=673940 RepID=A0ACB6RBZ6_9PLEO|nr:low-affinity zinc ion transporter-like protein [Lindgomyces ingoldianus]KAF2476565.1 low-affinity zinc ion transporter-like protein [Lindgomyces ingoldianus]
MVLPLDLAHLLVRQHDGTEEPSPVNCETGNGYDGRMGVRISAVFVILVGSMLGAMFPVYARRHSGLGVPDWAFFVAKYFGSGVIIATAFIHLLAPANEALGNGCLTGAITEYPWVEGIALMTIMLMFFLELMTMRYGNFGGEHSHSHGHSHPSALPQGSNSDDISLNSPKKYETRGESPGHGHHHTPGEDHLGHAREHTDNAIVNPDWLEHGIVPETYAAQITAIFILEFGVIFHSIFVGLTLAVAGSEFVTLYIVLVFHQTFEGLGLGSRLATVPWPKSKRWTPYILGFAYGISTPIAIAIGLGVRNTYPPESATTLIVNGVFDSISAGILIYTGLVELMAHEFMFSPYMQKGPIGRLLSAFVLMCLGAGLMALLGKWA